MTNLPKVARKKQSVQGKSLQTFVDEKILFSDQEELNTDGTDYTMPTRQEDPNNWHTWAQFYKHELKVEFTKIPDLVGQIDREGHLRALIENSGLTEKQDWWFDAEDNCLYLADEYFLLTWKMSNCRQFIENVKCVVYSSRR